MVIWVGNVIDGCSRTNDNATSQCIAAVLKVMTNRHARFKSCRVTSP